MWANKSTDVNSRTGSSEWEPVYVASKWRKNWISVLVLIVVPILVLIVIVIVILLLLLLLCTSNASLGFSCWGKGRIQKQEDVFSTSEWKRKRVEIVKCKGRSIKVVMLLHRVKHRFSWFNFPDVGTTSSSDGESVGFPRSTSTHLCSFWRGLPLLHLGYPHLPSGSVLQLWPYPHLATASFWTLILLILLGNHAHQLP